MSVTRVQLVGNVSTGASFSGIVTATSFSGDGSGLTGVANTDFIVGTSITMTTGTFTGNVSIAGTLTYEDVTNVDSIGIITARSGIDVLAGGISAVGVITATSFSGDGSGLSGVGVGTEDSINTSGIITASTISANEFIGTGDKLIFSPTITAFSPTDGATGVNALSSPDISLTYSQPVAIGTGTITLRTGSASGTIAESYEVGVSTRVTLSTQTLTVNPTDNFDYDTEYYLVVPVGAVKNNVDGNSALLDTYNFTTEAGPVVTSFNPTDGATGVSLGTNPVITFDKNIRAGVGTITLREDSAAGTIVASYEVGVSTSAVISGQTLTIYPSVGLVDNLDYDQEYYIVIPNNAIAGYAGTDTYNFTTEAGPVVTSFNPTNGATEVGLTTDVVITFDKNISAGVGTIRLEVGTGGTSIVESYDVSSSDRLTFSTNTLTIDPTSDLALNTNYYVVIPNNAIAGYAGTDTYNFTTFDKPTTPGSAYEGGYAICLSGGTIWVVAPSSSQVSRNWYSRADAVTTAQQAAACGDWFVPNIDQLQNPGLTCSGFWDSVSVPKYWSDTEYNSNGACIVNFQYGFRQTDNKGTSNFVRAFRCVSY